MNIPATVSITSCTVGLLFALFSLGVSWGPGWRELRWYALAVTFAGLFSATEAVSTLSVAPQTSVWASRIGMVLTGLHGAAWYMYAAAWDGRALHRYERAIITIGLILGTLSMVPGVVMTDEISIREVAWLGVTYQDGIPTNFAGAVYAFDIAAMLWLTGRYVRQSLAGVPFALPHAIGLGLLCLAGIHDSIAASTQLAMPYIVGLGNVAVICAVGWAIVMRFIGGARRLAEASKKLQAAQTELVRRERLAALGELAAVIAHEVRNPVAVIFNATATLRKDAPEPDRTNLVDIVVEEAERLRRIVDDLLLFTRPSGALLPNINVSELMESAVRAATDAATEKAPAVALDLEQGVSIPGDERLLRQALINLITNAMQASRDGRVSVCVRQVGGEVVFAIEDDGDGVSPALAEKIFEPFFTTRATGTGLGLAIVRRVAEEHRGSVALEPGPPTRMVLRLPK